jgi:hypothetical protein
VNTRSPLRKLGAGNPQTRRNPAPPLEIMGAGNSVESGVFGRNGRGEPLDPRKGYENTALIGRGGLLARPGR